MILAFSPLRTDPPNALACLNVIQPLDVYPVDHSSITLMPLYRRFVAALYGYTASPSFMFHGLRHGFVPCSSALMIRWVTVSYKSNLAAIIRNSSSMKLLQHSHCLTCCKPSQCVARILPE